MGIGKGSSLSKCFRILSSRQTKNGRIDVEKTLNPKAVCDHRAKTFSDLQIKLAGKHLILAI